MFKHMSDRLPVKVPLPEVPRYTDEIVFGELMFPVGFDQEQLEVYLRAIQRVRKAAMLGSISVVGIKGDVSSYDYDITGIDSSGAGTFSGKLKKHKQDLSGCNVTYPTPVTIFDRPKVVIEVNTNESDERIRESGDEYDKGLVDPYARAKFLNKALRTGLRNACIDANIDTKKILSASMYYGIFGSIPPISGHDVALGEIIIAAMGPLIFNTNLIQKNYEDQILHDSSESLKDVLARSRQSLFYGMSLDRAAVGYALAMTSSFIKVRS